MLTTDRVEGLLNKGYNDIILDSNLDIIFYGDIMNHILDLAVRRLLAERYSVTILSKFSITSLSSRVICFIKLKELKDSLQTFR